MTEENLTEEPVMIPKKVGEILSDARKKQKRSMEKIVADLHIRRVYIEALEESDYTAFPGLVYASGFLRNYARYLGLDAEELSRAYQEETAYLKPAPVFVQKSEHTISLPKFKHFVFALFLLGVIGCGAYFLSYQKKQQNAETLKQLVEEVPTVVPVEETQLMENTQQEETTPTEETPVQEKEQPAKTEQPTTRIQITAVSESWIEIQDEDLIVVSRVLKAGESYNVPENSENMRLKTGNAGGLEVYVDGQKIAPLGKSGAVVSKISLNPEELKNR